jgi:hypothetical protein
MVVVVVYAERRASADMLLCRCDGGTGQTGRSSPSRGTGCHAMLQCCEARGVQVEMASELVVLRAVQASRVTEEAEWMPRGGDSRTFNVGSNPAPRVSLEGKSVDSAAGQ